MGDLVFQTGVLTFASLMVGAMLLGGIAVRLRQRPAPPFHPVASTDENLYIAFSRISHQLKSSGEIVRGHLRGFTDELPSDHDKWKVARRAIFDEASQITTMVERLDLVVRVGMTDEPFVMEAVDIVGMIENLMMQLAPAADERGVLLGGIESRSTGMQSLVWGDSAALREAFSNVLENAVVHCGHDSEVSAVADVRNGRLMIQIKDTGVGMDSEKVKDLFKPGDAQRPGGGRRGTGMGLYLSKMLIENHGGTIFAHSSPGMGTTFDISLPVRK